jgi:hypothetical protein
MVNPSKRPQHTAASAPSYANERDFLRREKTYLSSFYARALLGWEFLRCRCFFNCSTKTKVFLVFLFVCALQRGNTSSYACFRYVWRCIRGAFAPHLSPLREEKRTLRRDPLFVARSQLFVFVIGKNAEGVIKALFPRRTYFFLFISRRAV